MELKHLLGEDYYEDEPKEEIDDTEPVDVRMKRHRSCMGDDSVGGDAPGSSMSGERKKKKKKKK